MGMSMSMMRMMMRMRMEALQVLMIALVLTVSLTSDVLVTDAFQRPGTFHSLHFRTKRLHMLVNDPRDPALNALGYPQTPGHTSASPISIGQQSRLEMVKIVVALSIAVLTWRINSENFWNTLLKKENSNLIKSENESVQDIPGTGILIEDVIVEKSQAPLNDGDTVVYDIKLFYNGLRIKSFNNGNSLIPVKYGKSSAIFDDLSLSGLNVERVIDNMTYGSRRKILLPSKYAFGDRGYMPYIPADASVMVDIILLPKRLTEKSILS